MTNEPAFPVQGQFYGDQLGGQLHHGMSLRDYLAAKAMQGFLASATLFDQSDGVISAYAYRMADAMLAEREKGNPK